MTPILITLTMAMITAAAARAVLLARQKAAVWVKK